MPEVTAPSSTCAAARAGCRRHYFPHSIDGGRERKVREGEMGCRTRVDREGIQLLTAKSDQRGWRGQMQRAIIVVVRLPFDRVAATEACCGCFLCIWERSWI